MMKKLLLCLALFAFGASSFAGYSGGGGRSGFSGGGRSYSSSSFGRSSSYSSGRSGYSRSTNTTRAYSAPRSSSYSSNYGRGYPSSSRTTVIHNSHYHGAYGYGYGGGGFFNGFLGGYLGGMMSGGGYHNPVVVAQGAPVVADNALVGNGQGALIEGGYPLARTSAIDVIMAFFIFVFFSLLAIWTAVAIWRFMFSQTMKRW